MYVVKDVLKYSDDDTIKVRKFKDHKDRDITLHELVDKYYNNPREYANHVDCLQKLLTQILFKSYSDLYHEKTCEQTMPVRRNSGQN